MKLRDLIVDTKTVWVPFDGYEDFEVELAYIPRTEMTKMVKECQRTKMNRATRQIETELDQEKFLSTFVERAIKNWKGLTLSILSDFVPIDYNPEDADKELGFDSDNAIFLIKQSQMFDDWVNEKINDIDTFRK